MRRFYGYLVLVVSLLLIVSCNLQSFVSNISSGIEYSGGYEVLYKVDYKDSNKTIDDIANIVVNRIEDAGVQNAVVQSESGDLTGSEDDFIRVQMSGNSETDIDYVLRSVEATGRLTVSTIMDGANYPELENPFEIGSAKVNWNQSTPYVEVGIKNAKEFISFVENCNKDYEEFNEIYNKDSQEESSVEGIMVIWLDKLDDDSYIQAYENESEVKKAEIRDRVLAIVPTNNFYYTEKNGDYVDVKLLISYYDFDQVQMVGESAHTIERVINYGAQDYSMNRLYTHRIGASVTNIEVYDQIIIWGTFVSLVAILGFLVFRFGLAGFTGFVAILVSMTVQLFLFNFLDYTFSTIAAIGFVASIAINTAAVILFLSKFKNELYKGKSPLKSYQEASKNTLVNVIDATILGIAISVVGILSFSSQIVSLPIVLCIGLVCSLIFNRLIMRFAMWWLTNNSLANNKPIIFRVKTEDVPDIMKMETQRKFAPLSNIDPKKKGKLSALVAGISSVVCILLIAVFAIIPGVNVFNDAAESRNYSRIEISAETVNSNYLFDKKSENVKAFFSEKYPDLVITNVDVNVVQNVVGDPSSSKENLVNIGYYSITLDKVIDTDDLANDIAIKLNATYGIEDTDLTVNVVTCSPKSVNYLFQSAIVAAVLVGSLAIVFILVRFGYIYALSTLATLVPTTLVSLGFFAATRLPINSLSLAGIAAGLLIVVLAQLPLYERIKKMRRESKIKITTYEQRETIAIASFKETAFVSLMTSMMALVAIVIVALFSPLTSSVVATYGIMAITVIVGAASTLFLLIPVYLFLQKKISFNISINREKRNKKAMEKAKEANRKAGAEPVEAKIPGINC